MEKSTTVLREEEPVQSSSLLSKESSMISLAINKDEHEYVVPRCKETVIEHMIRRKRRDTTRMAAKMGRRAICSNLYGKRASESGSKGNCWVVTIVFPVGKTLIGRRH